MGSTDSIVVRNEQVSNSGGILMSPDDFLPTTLWYLVRCFC